MQTLGRDGGRRADEGAGGDAFHGEVLVRGDEEGRGKEGALGLCASFRERRDGGAVTWVDALEWLSDQGCHGKASHLSSQERRVTPH